MNKLLTIFAIAFGLAGTAAAEPLYPLSVGMYWTYQVGDNSKPITNKIVSKKSILGNDWYQLNEFGDTFWVRNTNEGQVEAINLWGTAAQNVNSIDELLVYKYPYQDGETYKLGEDSVTVGGIKTITVPAGTFQCIDYRIQMTDTDYSISCVARGVGVVQNEFMHNGTLTFSKLTEYGSK
jgi:hypothetical protein